MAAGSGGGFTPPAPPPPAGLTVWNAALAALPTTIKYTLIGTSVTFGTGASDTAHSWAGLLQSDLVAAYGAHFTKTNTGFSGARIGDFLGNVGSTPADTSLVTIELGINDCNDGMSAATFQADLETLIDELAAVTAASILVIGAYRIDAFTAGQWDPYLAAMAAAAAAKGTAYLSVAPDFLAGDTGPIAFAGPGSSAVVQGFTVNDFSGPFDLESGARLTKTITSAFSSGGVGVICATGGYNESHTSGVGTEVFTRANGDQTGCVLYAFPYSAGYTGAGTFVYSRGYLGDGIHPNDRGHALFEDLVYAVLT